LEQTYNFDVNTRKKAPYYKSYEYDGQKFTTIKSLFEYFNSKGLKDGTLSRPLSETTFRRNYLNPYAPLKDQIRFIQITKQFQKYLINGEICNGLEEIVEKGFAKNTRQAAYRLSSAKWPNYKYIDKIKVQKKRRKVSINGQLYTTEDAIEAKLAENRDVLYYRIKSKSEIWKAWFWIN
jgi:hypothetical protein